MKSIKARFAAVLAGMLCLMAAGASAQLAVNQTEGFGSRLMKLAALCGAGHDSRREHQPVDPVAAKAEGQRRLREARQF